VSNLIIIDYKNRLSRDYLTLDGDMVMSDDNDNIKESIN
jgi:hypothetical protein